jgi:hypothetical protein
MATNLVVNFIGKNQLSKTTAVMNKDLRKFKGQVDMVGKSMKNSFGALGLSIGLAAVVNGLKNATKAASEDRKSQGLLANALQRTVGATDDVIAGAERYIKKTQLSTAVLDDDLRPALTKAVRATGSLSKGQRLLDIALDVSAETGKDLGTVTGALSKAYTGNTASLKKLVPGIQLGVDWMGQLETAFQGTAEKAADLDPYKRLQVIFADIQEEVGTALLPALEEFSAYLASPEGQENVRVIVDLFVAMGKAVADVIVWLIKNIAVVKTVIAIVLVLKLGWIAVVTIVKLYTTATITATTATKALKYALISTGLGAIAVAVGTLASSWLEATDNAEAYTEVDINEPPAIDPRIPPPETGQDTSWWYLGFASRQDYLDSLKAASDEAKRLAEEKAKELAKAIRNALDNKVEGIKKTAEKFRESVSTAFGLFGDDEYAVFNVDYFVGKLKRMVAAAKGFAQNLAKINKIDPSGSLANELIAMGPVEGNIAAQGLLASGQLKDIVGLRTQLYGVGAQAGAVSAVAGNATYEININKAVISAADIIKEIRMLEKKTGRKYLVN